MTKEERKTFAAVLNTSNMKFEYDPITEIYTYHDEWGIQKKIPTYGSNMLYCLKQLIDNTDFG